MTNQIALPPMHHRDPLTISRDRWDRHPAYGPLLAVAATTGRCPVWITECALEQLKPPADLGLVRARIGTVDVPGELARRWPGANPLLADWRAPFGAEFPGLAAAREPLDEPIESAVDLADEIAPAHLALVPVTRPADAVAALGWTGAINYGEDVAMLSAVLRSWEDRFGARLVMLFRSTLWLSVAAPPRTERACLAVAAEHFSFCPDVDGEDPRPLAEYAATLRGCRWWRFWWD